MHDPRFRSTSPVVSVIIPAKDCLPYLPAAVASVEAQGVRDLEVIVVDDGSTDGSAEWLREKRRAAAWLTVLQGAGQGPAAARNRAIAAARAPLVAFLDAEDAWLPGKLRAQLAFHAADPEVGFSFMDCRRPDIGSSGTWFGASPAFRRLAAKAAAAGGGFRRLERAPTLLLVAESVVASCTVMARRELLQNAAGSDPLLHSAEDWGLWLRLACMAPVGFTPAIGAERAARRPGAARRDARPYIACMRRALAAHAPAVVIGKGGGAAVRRARAHILSAEADLARMEGRHHAAAAARLGSLWRAPSWRLLGAFSGDLLRAAAADLLRATAAARPRAAPPSGR